jgi:hypothetical protein
VWKWTYFKGKFKARNGVVIEDENFMADDSGRSRLSGSVGSWTAHVTVRMGRRSFVSWIPRPHIPPSEPR